MATCGYWSWTSYSDLSIPVNGKSAVFDAVSIYYNTDEVFFISIIPPISRPFTVQWVSRID